MRHYNICMKKTMYNMGTKEAALTALLDLAKMPLLYGKSFHTEVFNGIRADFKELVDMDIFKECFELFSRGGPFLNYCILGGTSDAQGIRKVEIIWDSAVNEEALILTLHGGLPATKEERKIIDAVQNLWPGLLESRNSGTQESSDRRHPEGADRLQPDFDSLTDAEKIVLMEEFDEKGRTMDFSNFARVEGHREPAGCHCYMFADVIDSRGSRGERFLGECGVRFTDVTRMDPNEHGYALTCCMVPENDMTAFRVAMEHLKTVTTKEDDVYPIYCQLMLRYT